MTNLNPPSTPADRRVFGFALSSLAVGIVSWALAYIGTLLLLPVAVALAVIALSIGWRDQTARLAIAGRVLAILVIVGVGGITVWLADGIDWLMGV